MATLYQKVSSADSNQSNPYSAFASELYHKASRHIGERLRVVRKELQKIAGQIAEIGSLLESGEINEEEAEQAFAEKMELLDLMYSRKSSPIRQALDATRASVFSVATLEEDQEFESVV